MSAAVMAPAGAPAPATAAAAAMPQPGAQQPSSLSRLTLSDKLLLAQAVHHIGTSPPDWGRVSSVLLSHPLIKTKMRLEQAARAGITLGRVFGSRECERAWTALMRQYNLVLQPGEKDPSLEHGTSIFSQDQENSNPQLSPTSTLAPNSLGISNTASIAAHGTPQPPTPGSSPATPRTKEARGFPPRMDRASQLALAQFLYAERILEIQESIKAKEAAFKALVTEIDALQSGSLDAKLLEEIEKSTPGQEQALVEQTDRELAAVDGILSSPTAAPVSTANVAPTRGRISRGGSVTNLPIVSPTRPPPMPDLRLSQPTSPTTVIHKTLERGQQNKDEAKQIAAEVKAHNDKAEVEESGQNSTAETETRPDDSVEKKDLGPEATSLDDQGDAAGAKEVDSTDIEAPASLKRKRGEEEGEGEIEKASEVVKRARTSSQDLSEAAVASEIEQQTPSNVAPIEEAIAEPREKQQDVSAPEASSEIQNAKAEERGEAERMRTNSEQAADKDPDAVDEEEVETASPRRPEARRSRRSARNVESDDQMTPTPPTSAASKKNRVEALRSRQTSGASAEADEDHDADTQEDTSKSTIESRARTSTSPAAIKRPRHTGRQSSAAAGSGTVRKNRRSSVSLGAQGDETTSDVEREKERVAQAAKQRKNEKVLMMLLNEVSNHTHGNLFHAPIRESDAPDYYTLIRHPLDLKTIKARIKEGRITTAMQLRRALNQMFANSLIYNRPGTEVHRMALEMRDAAEQMLDQFEQTQRSAKHRR